MTAAEGIAADTKDPAKKKLINQAIDNLRDKTAAVIEAMKGVIAHPDGSNFHYFVLSFRS